MSNPFYARLRLTIKGLKIDSYTPRNLNVNIRLAHRVFVTPKHPPNVPWDETYEFELSFHEHLFWILQFDVCDSRLLLPRTVIGRTEIRLYKLEGKGTIREKWFPLRDKHHCYANLCDLELPKDIEKQNLGNIGSICLTIQYKVLQEKIEPFQGNQVLPDFQTFVTPPSLPFIITHERSKSMPCLPMANQELSPINGTFDSHMRKSCVERRHDNDSNLSLPRNTAPSPTLTSHAEDELEEIRAEIRASKEINSFLKRITGWVFTNEDYTVVQKILNGLSGFGQGIEVGNISLTVGFFLLQKFYRSLPAIFTNNIVLKKEDLEIPRIIFRYAYAAHGWAALYVFGKRNELFKDTMQSDANYKAVMEFLQIDPKDMLICDLDQHRLFRPNFYVTIDRRLSAIILSIRGTMSLRDTLTDFSYEYTQWHGGMAHSGMLTSAKWFMDYIAHRLVTFAREYNVESIYITGHSLGGGTASLLSIMLTEQLQKDDCWPTRLDGKRINIHCYAYGTPAVLSSDLAEKYTNLIDTFIYGDDIVPRLSYGTVVDLQILLVYAAETGRGIDLFSSIRGTELFNKLHECRSIISKGEKVCNLKLRIPGRVHHLITLKAPNDRRYTVVDTCDSERFLECSLRKNMLIDHLPSRYETAFEEAYVSYILHELEERQGNQKVKTSLKERIGNIVGEMNSNNDDDNNNDSSKSPQSLID